jgi:hypothetical protein
MRSLTSLAAAGVLLLSTSTFAADAPPTVAQPAQPNFWSPESAVLLSVLGADDGGEAALTYTWSGTGPGTLTFDVNGTNAAKSSRVVFGKAGGYTITCTIRDGSGQTVQSAFGIGVVQRLTTLTILPGPAVPAGGSRRFRAEGKDQFGDPYSSGDFIQIFNLGWSVDAGGIMDASSGVLQADSIPGGPYTVHAMAEGGVEAYATFDVVPATHVTLSPTADGDVRSASPSTIFGSATSLTVRTPESAAADTRVSYLRFPLTSAPAGMIAATLRVYGQRPIASNRGISAYAVADNTWQESTLTFNNRPALAAREEGPVEIGTTAQYWDFDVLSWVAAEKAAGKTSVSLALAMDFLSTIQDPDTFNSREAAANKPQLRISYSDPGVPTVVTAAAASPAVVTGTTTRLTVQGGDDQGEAGLTYTWQTVGTAPASVGFSPNGTNAAKTTTATFAKIGEYRLRCVIRDASGKSVASDVVTPVPETITTLKIVPENTIVPVGGTAWFSAYGVDQFGVTIDYGHDGPVPAEDFSVTGGGTMTGNGTFTAGSTPGGPFIVNASFEGATGSATLRVATTATSVLAPLADAYVRDGSSASTNFGTATSLVVKTTATAGNNRISYLRFPLTGVGTNILTATLRLYGSHPTDSIGTTFPWGVSSTTWTETGITWNNKPALVESQGATGQVTTTPQYVQWDVKNWVRAQRAAGASSLSLALKMDNAIDPGPDTFNSREAASNRPQLVIVYTQDVNGPPTVARAASASPTFVTGRTTQLSVLGADDGGESALTYTWESLPTGWGPVTFSTNGSNAAKNTTATFVNQGHYDLRVTIRDAAGLSTTSQVHVDVEPTLASIQVVPPTQATDPGGSCAFNARGFDQFGSDMGSVDDPWLPDPVWSVSGGGTMNGNLFQAGPTPGGPFTVTAQKDNVSGTATVRVAVSQTITLGPTADAYVRDGSSASTNFGTATTLQTKNTTQAGNNRISFLKFSLASVAPDVTRAVLRIYGNRTTVIDANTTGVRSVANNSWTETGVTWNNKPAIGTFNEGHSFPLGTTPQYWEYDITDYVRAQRAAGTTLSVALNMDAVITDGPDTFNSREASTNKPQLVVTSR